MNRLVMIVIVTPVSEAGVDTFGLNQGLSSASFIVTSFKTFSRSEVSFAKDDNAIVTRKKVTG